MLRKNNEIKGCNLFTVIKNIKFLESIFQPPISSCTFHISQEKDEEFSCPLKYAKNDLFIIFLCIQRVYGK